MCVLFFLQQNGEEFPAEEKGEGDTLEWSEEEVDTCRGSPFFFFLCGNDKKSVLF